MKILHVIKERDHALAISTVREQTVLPPAAENDVTVLLIHDAVLTAEDRLKGLRVTALKDDAAARAAEPPYPSVDYNGMLKLVFESDRVICW